MNMIKPNARKSIHDPSTTDTDQSNEHNHSYNADDTLSSENSKDSDHDDWATHSSERRLNASDDRLNVQKRRNQFSKLNTSEQQVRRRGTGGDSQQYDHNYKLQKATEQKQPDEQNEDQSSYGKVIILVAFLIVAIAIGIYSYTANKDQSISKPNCQQETLPLNAAFSPEQEIAIISAVQEIKMFDKPSVLMLINSSKSKSKEDSLAMNLRLQRLLNYTACELNGSHDIVHIFQKELHSPEIMADKGMIITKYSGELEEKGVLLVKNLQETPAQVAMAFHFLCDEYTPVVKRALIIFTLLYDVNLEYESDFNIVEKVLTDQWGKELKADFLMPLIARLTNAIIRL